MHLEKQLSNAWWVGHIGWKVKSHFWSFMYTLLIQIYNGHYDFISVIKVHLKLTCKMNSGVIWANYITRCFCSRWKCHYSPPTCGTQSCFSKGNQLHLTFIISIVAFSLGILFWRTKCLMTSCCQRKFFFSFRPRAQNITGRVKHGLCCGFGHLELVHKVSAS